MKIKKLITGIVSIMMIFTSVAGNLSNGKNLSDNITHKIPVINEKQYNFLYDLSIFLNANIVNINPIIVINPISKINSLSSV